MRDVDESGLADWHYNTKLSAGTRYTPRVYREVVLSTIRRNVTALEPLMGPAQLQNPDFAGLAFPHFESLAFFCC